MNGFRKFVGTDDGIRMDAEHEIHLEVDGGINDITAREVINAGADVIVAGTATFEGGQEHYAKNISKLRGK